MTAVALVSSITVLLSLAAKISLAGQVHLNYRRRSVDGLSMPFYLVGIGSYTSWVVLGCLESNWVVIAAQLPGALLMLAVGAQWLYYRKTH